MTIQEIFDYVDEIKRNSFSKLVKTIWLNELEGKIQNEIMLLAQPECIRYVYESEGTLSGISFPDKRSLKLRSPIKCHEGGLLTLSGLETYVGNNLSGLEILNISKDKLTLTFAENTFPEVGDEPDSGSYSFDGKDTEMLVKNPFDRIYAPWILAKISEHLEESNQAANYIAKFKDEWEIFAAWYATTYRPADGKPMFLGYYLRGNDGDRGKQGEQGEDGIGIVRLFIESDRLKYELTDGTIADAGPVSGIEIDPTLSIEGAAAEAKVVGEEIDRLNDTLNEISVCVPSQASYRNQLADKAFVNSSIGTNTAYYISDNGQPFASLAQLQAYSGTVTNNDYAFVVGTDSAGNTTYTRYKYNADTQTWAAEYVLNNSSFTAAQWASIESGITAALVASYNAHIADDDIHVTREEKTSWNGKLTDAPSDGKQYARKNGAWSEVQGGGADNTFVVTGEYDGSQWGSFDKTFAEIDAAAAAKKIIELHMHTDEQISYYILPMVGNNGSGLITFAGYDAVDYDAEHNIIVVTVDDSDTWSISHPDYAQKSDLDAFVIDYSNPASTDYANAVATFDAGREVKLRRDNTELPMTGYDSNHCYFGGTLSAYLPGGYVIAVYAHIGPDGQNYFWYEYQSAIDGAQKPLVVSITQSGGLSNYSADKTNAEIYAAWQAGREVIASINGGKLPCLQADATSAYFNLLIGGDGVSYGLVSIITTGESQTVTETMTALQPETITDSAGYFTTDTVEGALAEIGGTLDGVETALHNINTILGGAL